MYSVQILKEGDVSGEIFSPEFQTLSKACRFVEKCIDFFATCENDYFSYNDYSVVFKKDGERIYVRCGENLERFLESN